VGTSHKCTSGPFQGSQQHIHWPNSGPFQGSADNPHEQQSGPFQGPNQTATHRYQRPFSGPRATVYSGQSEVSLFQPITSRFILTNHTSVYCDQSQTTQQQQPSDPNKRRPPGLVKPVRGVGGWQWSSEDSELRDNWLFD